MLHSVVDKLGFFLDVELVHDTGAIGINRFGAEGENFGNFAVGEAFGKVAEDFAFADAEENIGISDVCFGGGGAEQAVNERLGDGFVEVFFAVVDFVDGGNQLAVGGFFEQVSVGSGSHDFFDIFFVVVHGQHEDVAVQSARADFFDTVDATHVRHG